MRRLSLLYQRFLADVSFHHTNTLYRKELAQMEVWAVSLAERGLPLKRFVFDSRHPKLEGLAQRFRDAGVVEVVTCNDTT
jgi:hypothetical protein